MKVYVEEREVKLMEEKATCLRDKLLIKVLFHLGCRVSEALSLRVEDIDFNLGVVTIKHLKTRLKLYCPKCNARLSKAHKFCPGCGEGVEKILSQQYEHRRMRTLPVDPVTIELLRDYIKRGGAVTHGGKKLLFGIGRHRAWQIIRDCANKAGLSKLINPETGKTHNVSPH
jgi:integrase/recombinase XerD